MAYTSILNADIDAKSPLTDALFLTIKTDLDDLDARLSALGGGGPFEWKLNGRLDFTLGLSAASQGVPAGVFTRVDDIFLAKEGTYTQHKIYLGTPGDGGTLEVDVRKYRALNIPIQSITRLFNDTITSISEIAATNTQSITRATAQINTQSITYFKAAINISSIVVSGSEMRVNLAAAPDSDAIVGDSYTVAGASSGANNGTFVILRKSDDGLNNVILTNASAVDQSTATGTVRLAAFSYNLSGSANAHFVAGENVLMAAHTAGANDGIFVIYAVNSGANNIVVKNISGVVQGGVAGTIDCLRLSFNFSSSAGTEFSVGESVVCASHSSGNNNGTFVIRAVNSGGNNLILANTVITLQGGVAGTVKSLRKLVNLNLDPAGLVGVGETVVISGGSNAAFDGVYAAKEIKRGGTNNVVFYNATAGTGTGTGSFYSGRVKIAFSSSHASDITTNSRIEISGCANSGNDGMWPVIAVDYASGTNVLVDNALNVSQASPMGRVDIESKSLFTVTPTIGFVNNGYNMNSSSNGTFGPEAEVETGDMLGLEIKQIPSGDASDIYVQIF